MDKSQEQLEKEVVGAIHSFILFFSLAFRNQRLKKEQYDKTKKEINQLLEEHKKKKVQAEEMGQRLNKLIKETNAQLDPPPEQEPYPLFSFTSPLFFVKECIVAFEHYLNQLMVGGVMTYSDQNPLFQQAFEIWEAVGRRISVEEGVEQFKALIERTNDRLADPDKYPLPN